MRKAWNFSYSQTESMWSAFERVLQELEGISSAIVLPDGKALHARAFHPADVATLPVAANQFHQYLHLKDGDIALGNDPYAGGTRLSDVTLVAAVSFETTGDPCELLLAARVPFMPRFSLEGKLDQEGLRLPPMPLVSGGKLNREILAAIGNAPNAPEGLAAGLESAVEGIKRASAILKAHGRDPHSDLRKANFKRYLQDTKDAVRHFIGRLPLGETLVTSHLETGELLKLRLEVVDDRAIFDFTGTEPSSSVQLTDLTTFGACFAAIEATLGRRLPANAGAFQLIEVHAPTRTWVNAKAPAATSRGVSDGLAIVASLALKGFGKLSSTHKIGAAGIGSCRIQFEFEDGTYFSDVAPGGTAAAKDLAGIDGWNIWLHGDSQGGSVERAEMLHPILVKSVVLRPGSGGKGKWNGGQGVVKSYAVLKPAKLTWALEQASTKPEGADGGKAGMGAEIVIVRTGETEKEKLESAGKTQLNPGDVIRILSAGGGGFGEPEASAT